MIRARRRYRACTLRPEYECAVFDGLAVIVQGVLHLLHHRMRHLPVDIASQFDETHFDAGLFRFPGEIERVDLNAMASSPAPGQKGMKPKGLVAAASITPQILLDLRSHIMANS